MSPLRVVFSTESDSGEVAECFAEPDGREPPALDSIAAVYRKDYLLKASDREQQPRGGGGWCRPATVGQERDPLAAAPTSHGVERDGGIMRE
jgi:hypothetical protein